VEPAPTRPGSPTARSAALALTRFVYQALLDPEAEQAKDAWDLAAFGQHGHLDFTVISQPWTTTTPSALTSRNGSNRSPVVSSDPSRGTTSRDRSRGTPRL
jgi:hypothetical protein